MNLSELRDLIRAEATIGGLRQYDTMIDAIVNQELFSMTGKSKYEELREDETFTSVADNTYQFDLPSDFQLIGSIVYKRPLTDPNFSSILSPANIQKNQWEQYSYGRPLYYKKVGMQLWVYPYSEFYSGDTLDFAYYKKPLLVMDSDEMPVPNLEKALIQAVIGRMLMMTDSKRAQVALVQANRAWQDVRAHNAGN